MGKIGTFTTEKYGDFFHNRILAFYTSKE